jgi:hypothetical protein
MIFASFASEDTQFSSEHQNIHYAGPTVLPISESLLARVNSGTTPVRDHTPSFDTGDMKKQSRYGDFMQPESGFVGEGQTKTQEMAVEAARPRL